MSIGIRHARSHSLQRVVALHRDIGTRQVRAMSAIGIPCVFVGDIHQQRARGIGDGCNAVWDAHALAAFAIDDEVARIAHKCRGAVCRETDGDVCRVVDCQRRQRITAHHRHPRHIGQRDVNIACRPRAVVVDLEIHNLALATGHRRNKRSRRNIQSGTLRHTVVPCAEAHGRAFTADGTETHLIIIHTCGDLRAADNELQVARGHACKVQRNKLHRAAIRQRHRCNLYIGERNLATITHGNDTRVRLVYGRLPQYPVGGGQHHAGNIEVIMHRRAITARTARAYGIVARFRMLRGEHHRKPSIGIRNGGEGADIIHHAHIDLHLQAGNRLVERIGHPSMDGDLAIHRIDISIHISGECQIIRKMSFYRKGSHQSVAIESHLSRVLGLCHRRMERKLHTTTAQTIPSSRGKKRKGGGIRACQLITDHAVQGNSVHLEPDATRAIKLHFAHIHGIVCIDSQGWSHIQCKLTC